jgi:acetylornithine deacetylase/succinyl-diaminopimelate desuccinylase-like protein
MKSLAKETLDLAIRIQQIPAPTFSERARAVFVRDRMMALGIDDVEIDEICNVYARIPGADPIGSPPVVVSAHLDTVFPEGTSLKITEENGRITGPGIGDNSLAVAGLVGLARMALDLGEPLPGDIWLVANVGEEGLGNLRGMHRVVDRFGDQPAAYIVLEGTALGQVYHRGLSVRRFEVIVRTAGGHSWAHFGRPSAVHVLAHLITRLTELDLPAEPRSSYNAGPIAGGTTVNTIAAEASVQIDLRSESEVFAGELAERVLALAESFRSEDVRIELVPIGNRPGGELPADHPLVDLAMRSLVDLEITPALKIGSTDANIPLSRGLPAICIGLTQGGGGHSLEEYILTGPLEQGLRHVSEVVFGIMKN